MTAAEYTAPQFLGRLQSRSLVVGIAAVAVWAAGGLMGPADRFFHSYLLSYMFWLGIMLGCLAILMLQHLTGGSWGLVIRRLLESFTRTLPLAALLFVPLIFGLNSLYAWARPELVAADELLQHKSPYLNVPFFLLRAAGYFVIWGTLTFLLNAYSRKQDETGDKALTRKLQVISAPGLLVFGGTVTFASVDWVMSLYPHWFSTIYGILVMGGQGLSAMAFVIMVLFLLSNHPPLSSVLSPKHFHDLGKLMLAFVMLWAYFSFSQWLIIWAGNLPEETPWYVERLHHGWQWVGGALILFHFALPFVLLLPRSTNRNARFLAGIAGLILVMRYVDWFWLVGPGPHEVAFPIGWMDFVGPIGLGGLWVAFFVWQLRRRPLLPLNDPHLEEAIEHGREEPSP